MLQIECDNRKEIDYLKRIIEELHNKKCDHHEYEQIIMSKDKEIEYLKKLNEEADRSIKENRDYYDNIIRAKDKELDHTKRNMATEDYYINKLAEREQELGNLTVMFETIENEKNNLLSRVLNFIDCSQKYINFEKFKSDEIMLSELTLYFDKINQFIQNIVSDNQNFIHKNSCLEEEILRLKNQIDYLKQDISEIRY